MWQYRSVSRSGALCQAAILLVYFHDQWVCVMDGRCAVVLPAAATEENSVTPSC